MATSLLPYGDGWHRAEVHRCGDGLAPLGLFRTNVGGRNDHLRGAAVRMPLISLSDDLAGVPLVEGGDVGKHLPDLLVGQVLAEGRRHGLPGSSPRINLKRVSSSLLNTHASSRTAGPGSSSSVWIRYKTTSANYCGATTRPRCNRLPAMPTWWRQLMHYAHNKVILAMHGCSHQRHCSFT